MDDIRTKYRHEFQNWYSQLTNEDLMLIHRIDNLSWEIPGLTTNHVRQIYLNLFYDDLTETQRSMVETWLRYY